MLGHDRVPPERGRLARLALGLDGRQRPFPLGVDGDEPVDLELVARARARPRPSGRSRPSTGVPLGGDLGSAEPGCDRQPDIDGDAAARGARVQQIDAVGTARGHDLDVRQRLLLLVGVHAGVGAHACGGPFLEHQPQADRTQVAPRQAHQPARLEPQAAPVGIDAAQGALEHHRVQVEPAPVA